MKNLLCILFISCTGLLQANNISQFPSANVMATSGLTLRAVPTTTGQSLAVIPFGESLKIIEVLDKQETIEWMTGTWIKVKYDNYEGFVFDAFVSNLPVPVFEFELTQEDLDLTYPILAYAEYHFDEIKIPDTTEFDHQHSIVQYLEQGIILKREDSDYHFKTSITFQDKKIHEVYNLLKSMLMSKAEIDAFVNSTIFIADETGKISEIKVNIDSPVHIKLQDNGGVKASVITFHEGCGL